MVYYSMASVGVFMTAVWLAAVRRRNHAYVDRAWGAAVVVLAATCLLTADERTARSWLVAVLVMVWGVRLSAYLTWRDWGTGPDWRHRGPVRPLRSLLTLYWFQALAALAVGTPVFASMTAGQPASLGWLDLGGVVTWGLGFAFEVVADVQLATFRRGPHRADDVLHTGLWRYSRHPNYFGDAVQWWGLGMIGIAAGRWWAVLGPAGMTLVLLRMTGVTAMDSHMSSTRGEAYARYIRRTSAFIPLPAKEQNRVHAG